jgi:translation elongation factor aEF-1 beta
MGSVAVTFRVMPQDAESFEEMKKTFIETLKPYKVEEKEVAFGLKALHATFIVKDDAGGADKMEEVARGIKGVGQVDVESMDRL